MHLHYGDRHDAGDRKCGSASRQSRDQQDPAEKLAGDGQEGENRGDSQLPRKKLHRAIQPVSAEPAQHQLTTMSEEDYSKDESRKRERVILFLSLIHI